MTTVFTIIWAVAFLGLLGWLVFALATKRIDFTIFISLFIFVCAAGIGFYGLLDISYQLG